MLTIGADGDRKPHNNNHNSGGTQSFLFKTLHAGLQSLKPAANIWALILHEQMTTLTIYIYPSVITWEFWTFQSADQWTFPQERERGGGRRGKGGDNQSTRKKIPDNQCVHTDNQNTRKKIPDNQCENVYHICRAQQVLLLTGVKALTFQHRWPVDMMRASLPALTTSTTGYNVQLYSKTKVLISLFDDECGFEDRITDG